MKIHEAAKEMFRGLALVVAICVAAVAVLAPHRAEATTKSIQILKSPAALLTLPAGQVTVIPGTSGSWCSVMVWNHGAAEVFWGGPKINNVVTAGVTVNAIGSMAICSNTALCPGELLSINVMAGGIALLSVGGTTVKYVVGEGCQP